MSKQAYTIEIINSNDNSLCQTDYTETVFEILKTVYSHTELNYILEHLKTNKGGKFESCNLY